MIMRILVLLILSMISATFFRLGGSAKNGSWLDFAKNTKTRDIGCSLVFLAAFWGVFGLKMGFWWAYALTFFLSWGAMSTYWDFLFNDKDNFYAYGIGIGIASLPFIWCAIPWYAIIGRTICLALSFGLLNKYVNKWHIPHSDNIEEYLRGFLIIASLLTFLI